MDKEKQDEQKGRCGPVAFPNLGESAAVCSPRYLIRSVRLNIPAWHVGAREGEGGAGGGGRTELDTKTAGLSAEWHPSHLSHPKPQLPACVLSLQPAKRMVRGHSMHLALRAQQGVSPASLLFSCCELGEISRLSYVLELEMGATENTVPAGRKELK